MVCTRPDRYNLASPSDTDMNRPLPFALVLSLASASCADYVMPPGADAAVVADGSDASVDVFRPIPVNVTCTMAYGTTICEGRYVPTTLNPAVQEVRTGTGGTGEAARHYFCYPVGVAHNDKLLLYLVGTTDSPTQYIEFPRRACALGYAAVSIAYHNEVDSRSTCMANSGCYEAFRREIVYGMDALPDPIRINQTNSILGRFLGVLATLEEREVYFPPWRAIHTRVAARDFTKVAVAGHSQGSGHALFIARDFEVDRLIMLAGVTDRMNSGLGTHAAPAWIANWNPATAQTPSTRFFTYMHDDDGVAVVRQVLSNWDLLRVPAMECPWSAMGPYAPACHRVRHPPARCGGGEAHNMVMVGAFGSATNDCLLSGTMNRNDATFRHLLTTPTE